MSLEPADPWVRLREATRARVGLGRAGDALTTSANLALAAAHAQARDAVHEPFRPDSLELGGDTVLVHSAAPDRATYLQRPDLGRRLDEASRSVLAAGSADLAVVVADGLSPRAVHDHAAPVLDELRARLEGWSLAPVVVAQQARVALGDEVGETLGARMVLVLIGERPGMSAPDSLGAYLTFAPRVGRADSERNCVSNIRPPDGLTHAAAADVLVALMTESFRLGLSGVGLKDTGAALPPAAG